MIAKWVVAIALVGLPLTPAWAQRAPTGRQTYAFTNTISCLQAGQVVLQFPRVWNVETSWNRSNFTIEYAMPDGEHRTLNYDTANMTCLIEPWGKESVPVAERVAEQQRQKEEYQKRQEQIREFNRSRGLPTP